VYVAFSSVRIRYACAGESTIHHAVPKRGEMQDSLIEMFAWLFVKTEDEIVAEAEVAALHSMFLVEDPRPEPASSNG
jgi:hypothetical protein